MVFADDTTLPVLDPGRAGPRPDDCGATRSTTGPGAARRIRPPPMSTAEDRKGEHPAEASGGLPRQAAGRWLCRVPRPGRGRADASIELAFCWAHVRRQFYEFFASTKSPLAAEVLAQIAKLYAIEAGIRGQPPDVRQAVRQQRSRPMVEDLHLWLQDHVSRVSGWSDLAKAMRYALRHWSGLILFLDDGRLEMDTNVVERAIRPVTIEGPFCPYQPRSGGPLPLARAVWPQGPAALRRAAIWKRGCRR